MSDLETVGGQRGVGLLGGQEVNTLIAGERCVVAFLGLPVGCMMSPQ